MTYISYFRGAVWTPVALFPPAWLLDTVMSTRAPITLEQILLIYVLALGTVAYFIFAIWASHKIKIKTESEILRLAWWAPVIFIPFYGTPWIIYGVIRGRYPGTRYPGTDLNFSRDDCHANCGLSL